VKELFAFSPYEAGLLVLGLCLLLAVWLPVTLLRRYVTLPFIPILGGMALFWCLPDALTLEPFSAAKLSVWERLTEAVVVISLVGAGLKIDSRHLLLAPPIRRLLLVAMPLCIAAVALLAWGLAGLPVPAALLLGRRWPRPIPSSPATCKWTAPARATPTACASRSRPKPA